MLGHRGGSVGFEWRLLTPNTFLVRCIYLSPAPHGAPARMPDMRGFGHFQPFFLPFPPLFGLYRAPVRCVCPWHTMWHLRGLWGCWWEQKAPSSRHWAITGRHVARAHLYVEMSVSRLDMELSPSILEATLRNLVQSKADIELRSDRQ